MLHVTHKCSQCNETATFYQDDTYYCGKHWRLTPYAVDLALDRVNRLIEVEYEDTHQEDQQ